MPSSKIHSVYAVVGSDRFLRNEEIERIVVRLGPEVQDSGVLRVDGGEAELWEVLDEVRTPTLLGGRRVAVVDNTDAFLKKPRKDEVTELRAHSDQNRAPRGGSRVIKSRAPSRDHRKILEEYCGKPAEDSTLVLAFNSLPVTTRLYKVISKCGEVIKCDPPKGQAIGAWIVRRAAETYSKRVSAGTARSLREHVGDTLGLLDSELAKLAAYTGQRKEITLEDIGAVTGHHREEKVFAIMGAVAAGDVSKALKLWKQVLATDRAAEHRAIGGLSYAVRRLLQARRAWGAGATMGEIKRHVFMDERSLTRAMERFEVRDLERQQRDLLAADLAIKTGAAKTETAVEKFIVRYCADDSAPRTTYIGASG